METKQLTQTKFELSDGSTLKYCNTTQYKPITYKFLKDCLQKYLNDDKLTTNICNFIKESREKTIIPNIKRFP